MSRYIGKLIFLPVKRIRNNKILPFFALRILSE